MICLRLAAMLLIALDLWKTPWINKAEALYDDSLSVVHQGWFLHLIIELHKFIYIYMRYVIKVTV